MKLWMLVVCAFSMPLGACSDKGPNKIDSVEPKEELSSNPEGLEQAIEKAKKNGGNVVGIGGDGRNERLQFGKILSEDDSYSFRLSNNTDMAVAKTEHLVFAVTPKTGYKMNKEFPTKLKMSCGESVQVAKAEWTIAEATEWTEKRGAFSIAVESRSAGEHVCDGQFSFAVCTDTTCDPKKTTFQVQLTTK